MIRRGIQVFRSQAARLPAFVVPVRSVVSSAVTFKLSTPRTIAAPACAFSVPARKLATTSTQFSVGTTMEALANAPAVPLLPVVEPDADDAASIARWGKPLRDVIQDVAAAADKGEVAFHAKLAEYPGFDVNSVDYDAVLHLVAGSGNVAAAKMLLAHGADPNVARGYSEQGPLWDAAIGDRVEMVQLLLAAGADPAKLDCDNCWPLTGAITHGKPDNALAILAAAKNTPLPLATEECCWDRAAVDDLAFALRSPDYPQGMLLVLQALLERESYDAAFAASERNVTATLARYGTEEDEDSGSTAALVVAAHEVGAAIDVEALDNARIELARVHMQDESDRAHWEECRASAEAAQLLRQGNKDGGPATP